jgi:hypothetical protein
VPAIDHTPGESCGKEVADLLGEEVLKLQVILLLLLDHDIAPSL